MDPARHVTVQLTVQVRRHHLVVVHVRLHAQTVLATVVLLVIEHVQLHVVALVKDVTVLAEWLVRHAVVALVVQVHVQVVLVHVLGAVATVVLDAKVVELKTTLADAPGHVLATASLDAVVGARERVEAAVVVAQEDAKVSAQGYVQTIPIIQVVLMATVKVGVQAFARQCVQVAVASSVTVHNRVQMVGAVDATLSAVITVKVVVQEVVMRVA